MKTYKVYPKISKFGFLITTLLAVLGMMLVLAGIGLFPPFQEFLQNFRNAMEFLNRKPTQIILGGVLAIIFGRKWFKTLGRMINKTPVLIADDFGLEVNRGENFNVIAWEYIDGITIENYAKSNSQGKRPHLIIRYRDETAKKQDAKIFIPVWTLAGKPNQMIDGLNQRNKSLKF